MHDEPGISRDSVRNTHITVVLKSRNAAELGLVCRDVPRWPSSCLRPFRRQRQNNQNKTFQTATHRPYASGMSELFAADLRASAKTVRARGCKGVRASPRRSRQRLSYILPPFRPRQKARAKFSSSTQTRDNSRARKCMNAAAIFPEVPTRQRQTAFSDRETRP